MSNSVKKVRKARAASEGTTVEVQRVAKIFDLGTMNVEVETFFDPMSSETVLNFSLPADAPFPEPDEIVRACKKVGVEWPVTLANVPSRLSRSGEDLEPQPLTEAAYLRRIQLRLNEISLAEPFLASMSADERDMMDKALEAAFAAGADVATLSLRRQFLKDVAREKDGQRARLAGGEARRGKLKKGTQEICVFMHQLIANRNVKSIRHAASKAKDKGMGTSTAANQNLYANWIKRGGSGK